MCGGYGHLLSPVVIRGGSLYPPYRAASMLKKSMPGK